MNTDEYGEVVNGEETFSEIAKTLLTEFRAFVGWSDGCGYHLDILFTLYPKQWGPVQRGISPNTDMFVSVMGKGSFAFDPDAKGTHAEYYAEKLNIGKGETAFKLAELLEGVKENL
jgi:hypothetical protein